MVRENSPSVHGDLSRGLCRAPQDGGERSPLLPPDIENAPPCAPPHFGGEHSRFPQINFGGEQIQFGGEHLNFQNFAPPCAPPHFGGEHL